MKTETNKELEDLETDPCGRYLLRSAMQSYEKEEILSVCESSVKYLRKYVSGQTDVAKSYLIIDCLQRILLADLKLKIIKLFKKNYPELATSLEVKDEPKS